MYLLALSSAVPPHSYTQRECWEILQRSTYARQLSSRSMGLLEKVLTGEHGIARRHFAVPDDRIFDLDAEALNHAFEREAPALAARALARALDQAGLRATELDALHVCTCTGYICPGVSSHVAGQLGMRRDAILQDLVGLGCGAAIPTLRAASHGAVAEPVARIAVVAVEVCSAAFSLDNDPGVLISACLFGDGASASIWTGTRPEGAAWRTHGFQSLHLPEQREMLRFENRQGKLRNRLDRAVPELAADAVAQLLARNNGHSPGRIIAHPGGRDVLAAINGRLPGFPLEESHATLRKHGNMSSPSVMIALEQYLGSPHARTAVPDSLWLTAFGAGFSAHGCWLTSEGEG